MNDAGRTPSVELACRCGQVRGRANRIDPREGLRLICYCRDCQAFANHLGRGADILDEAGGTDIYQLAPTKLEITQGMDQVECLRLTDKGLYRWYAACCNTPIANTVSASVPFAGLVTVFVADPSQLDDRLGPIRARVQVKSATGPLPEAPPHCQGTLRYMLRLGRKMLSWKFTGAGTPSPFFGSDGSPVRKARIVKPG